MSAAAPPPGDLRAFARLLRDTLPQAGAGLGQVADIVTAAANQIEERAGFNEMQARVDELERREAGLLAILRRYRYAAAFAGADSWDPTEEVIDHLKWAAGHDVIELALISPNELAAIAAEYHRERS